MSPCHAVLISILTEAIRRHYSQDGRTYPSPSDTPCVVGYCAGGFAAAAVSSTSSLLDLIPIACDAVLVSFSTALCSFNARRRLLGEASFGEPWSVCLPGEARGTTGWDGKELREVVRDFCESSVSIRVSVGGCENYPMRERSTDMILCHLEEHSRFLREKATSRLDQCHRRNWIHHHQWPPRSPQGVRILHPSRCDQRQEFFTPHSSSHLLPLSCSSPLQRCRCRRGDVRSFNSPVCHRFSPLPSASHVSHDR